MPCYSEHVALHLGERKEHHVADTSPCVILYALLTTTYSRDKAIEMHSVFTTPSRAKEIWQETYLLGRHSILQSMLHSDGHIMTV